MTDSGTPFPPGTLVDHPRLPEWGPGKVLAVDGANVTVYFRDAPETRPGQAVKKINTCLAPLRKAGKQSDPFLDHLPPFDGVGFGSKKPRLSLEKGIEVFLKCFPLGFEDPGYLADKKTGERAYKVKAHQLYVETLADGKAEDLLEAGDIDELRRRVLAVQRRTNLVYPTEATAFADGLKDEAAAARFFEALLRLLARPGPSKARFEVLAAAAASLPAEEGKTSPSKWTIVTVLPFLARPQTHIFVKPTPTQQCADRMRFDLQYRAQPNWITYRKVLTLAELLLKELQPLGARDMIDVQSFMRVIAAYKGDSEVG